MDLTELYRLLSVSELRSLSMASDLESGDPTGTISDSWQQTIVGAANDGLLRLYSRFLLKEADLVFVQKEGQSLYPMKSKYAVSKTSQYPGATWDFFIQDTTAEPFRDDVIKILAAFDGCEKVLDDPEDCHSWFRPQATVLQIPEPIEGTVCSILYQARHPALGYDDPSQEIELPDCLQEALRAYIASKVFSGNGTPENLSRAQGHEANFETICLEAQAMSLVTTPDTLTNVRFHKRGWV